MYESCAMNLAALSGQVFLSHCELARLNMDTCRALFSGSWMHWERVLLAQTLEQVLTRHADALPWFVTQISGYTRGCMDIASETSANLGRCVSERHDVLVRHVGTTLEGMARSAWGTEAMLRALNLAPVEGDGVAVARSFPDRHMGWDRASAAEPEATKRQRFSAGRHQPHSQALSPRKDPS
jgi:phasin family protein